MGREKLSHFTIEDGNGVLSPPLWGEGDETGLASEMQ